MDGSCSFSFNPTVKEEGHVSVCFNSPVMKERPVHTVIIQQSEKRGL